MKKKRDQGQWMPTGTIEAFERKTGENMSVKDLLHYCVVSKEVWRG